MAFCTECGASLPENIKFCTTCGAPVKPAAAEAVPAVSAAVPAPAEVPAQSVQQPQFQQRQQTLQYQQIPQQQPSPQPHPAPQIQPLPGQPPNGGRYAVIGTAGYFGLILLFSLPLVGWIICVVMAFSSGNLNRRNLARAMLIFMIIGLVLSVMLYFVASWAWEAVVESLSGATIEATVGDAAEIGELGSFIDLLRQNN